MSGVLDASTDHSSEKYRCILISDFVRTVCGQDAYSLGAKFHHKPVVLLEVVIQIHF